MDDNDKCRRCGYIPNAEDKQDYLMLVIDEAGRVVNLCKHCWLKRRTSDK